MNVGPKHIVNTVNVATALFDCYRSTPVSARTLCARVGYSVSITETALRFLRESGIISSQQGKEGGYRVVKPEATVGDVIRAVPIKDIGIIQSPQITRSLDQVKIRDLCAELSQ